MNGTHHPTRRQLLKTAAASAAAVALSPLSRGLATNSLTRQSALQFGLVTYLWGKDMDLPTLISSCERSGLHGVELRTEHAHGVEPTLSEDERTEVRRRFEDSSVELVGYGSNAQYHEDDPEKVRQNVELTKAYIRLIHDCGGTGVKVKPNGFVDGVPREKTIEQIGHALNEVAAYGADYGQQIRVEVHGRGTSELPVVRDIFAVADHPNATVCWNSNDVDLQGAGLDQNFAMVRDRFGDTVHVRELNIGNYPYQELFDLMRSTEYSGWILLEARTNPDDKVAALIEQREVFEQMTGG